MNLIFDFKRLGDLLGHFYQITSVRYSLIDLSYNVIFASHNHSEFCQIINSSPEGHARCVACDAQEARHVDVSSNAHIYRCHAGAFEVILPIVDNGQLIAFLFFGQMLSSEQNIEAQWEFAKNSLGWHEDIDSLKEAFLKLKRLDKNTINACASILRACSSYIQLEGLVKSAAQSDIQKLKSYIDDNYSSRITLKDAEEALSMCKTKICGLTAKHGTTFTQMLREKRVNEAQSLLIATDMSIAQISDRVGVSDYNYFTKLFRSVTGESPREFRQKSNKENT